MDGDKFNEKYSFTKERIERVNTHISERRKKTLEHFGYNEPEGEVHATFHNKSPFLNVAEIIQTLPIDEGRKTRIIFDYDPDFAHCLLQINQSDELLQPLGKRGESMGEEITREELEFYDYLRRKDLRKKEREEADIADKEQNDSRPRVIWIDNKGEIEEAKRLAVGALTVACASMAVALCAVLFALAK